MSWGLHGGYERYLQTSHASLSSPRSPPSRWSLPSGSDPERASPLSSVRPAALCFAPTPIEHSTIIRRRPGPQKTKSATMAPWSLVWGMRWNEGDWVRCECCGSVCKVLVTSESHKVGLASSSGAGARERSMEGGGLLAMRKALGGPLGKPQASRSPHLQTSAEGGIYENFCKISLPEKIW